MDRLDAYFASLGTGARRLAYGEWGVRTEAAGRPLDIGVRARSGRLTAQACALPGGHPDPAELLRRNRGLAHVRYAATRSGEIWVIGDLPQAAASPAAVDALLGLVVDAVEALRE